MWRCGQSTATSCLSCNSTSHLALTMPIIMPQANVITSAIVAQKGESLKGMIGNITYHWGLDYPANKKFVADFKAKYKRMPEHHEAHPYIITSMFLSRPGKDKGRHLFRQIEESAAEPQDGNAGRANFR